MCRHSPQRFHSCPVTTLQCLTRNYFRYSITDTRVATFLPRLMIVVHNRFFLFGAIFKIIISTKNDKFDSKTLVWSCWHLFLYMVRRQPKNDDIYLPDIAETLETKRRRFERGQKYKITVKRREKQNELIS